MLEIKVPTNVLASVGLLSALLGQVVLAFAPDLASGLASILPTPAALATTLQPALEPADLRLLVLNALEELGLVDWPSLGRLPRDGEGERVVTGRRRRGCMSR